MNSSRFNRFAFILLSFILSLAFLSLLGCSKGKRVAVIDGQSIPLHYFLSTRDSQFSNKSLNQKNKVLDDFYATLLRAKAARDQGLDNNPDLKYELQGIRRNANLNAFYQAHVVNQVLPESELHNAYENMKQRRQVSRLLIRFGPGSKPNRTQQEALQLAQTIKEQIEAGGITFEQAVEQYSDDTVTKKKGGDMGFVSYVQLPPDIQKVIWNLQLNEVSDPIKTGVGYFLIKLTKITPVKLGGYQQEVDRIKSMMIRVRTDSIRKTWDRLRKKINEETKTTFNDSNLTTLGNEIYAVYARNHKHGEVKDLGSLVDSIKYVSPGTVNGKEVGPGELKETLRFAKENNFRGLNNGAATKRLIRFHLQMKVVDDYARAHGVESNDDLAEKTRWKQAKTLGDYYLNHVVLQHFPPTQDTLKAFYNREKSSRYASIDTVHVQEIYVSEKSLAEKLKDQITNGADFASMAKQNTERPGYQQKSGDLGWFPTDRYGAIGQTAATLQVGDVAGPIAVGTGWSVIKLIDKKPGKSKSFDDLLGKIRQDYIAKYRTKLIEQNLHQLEDKYHSKLNYSALQNAK